MNFRVKFSEQGSSFRAKFGEIHNVSDGGYDRGYAEGYEVGNSDGYTKGHTEGVELGQTQATDLFWETFQQGGNRTDYSHAFSGVGNWSNETLKPKYVLAPTNALNMFAYSNISVLPECDFSKATNLERVFTNNAAIEYLPELDFSSATTLFQGFRSCTGLKRIERLKVSNKLSFRANNSEFYVCVNLNRCIFEGEIQGGIDISWSPLDKESIVSIVNCLSLTTAGTIKLQAAAVKKAFETSAGANDGDTSEEWVELKATKPNWTITP